MSLISFLIWMRASQNLEKSHQNLMKEWTRRVSVPVQLLLVLGLCGLNHQGASHRPAHCGRMEAEVHQPLGDVHRLHARGLLEVAHVDDELVGNLWFNLKQDQTGLDRSARYTLDWTLNWAVLDCTDQRGRGKMSHRINSDI